MLAKRNFGEEDVGLGRVQQPAAGGGADAGESATNIAALTREDGRLTPDYHVCSAHYRFDLAMLGWEATLSPDGSRRD